MSRRNSGYFVSHPVNLLIHFSLSFRFLSSSRHLEGMAFRNGSPHGTLLVGMPEPLRHCRRFNSMDKGKQS